ncbi:exonuclease domain-containing protein [Pontibacter aquaedesilientis]|uniref:exonuclease domain-containing protein n=1 Tax=Pontibacter aquaedesilientis TaxID=2766980 RepID=UPI001CD16F55|nr:exonuclease domain-containing protein [Pontibacter aquaedesilientis]
MRQPRENDAASARSDWSASKTGRSRSRSASWFAPPENAYFYRNTAIHGIRPQDTCHSPSFEAVWREIKPYIEHQTVVAHNGAFDFSCLRHTLDYYGVEQPSYLPQCTLKIYKKDLATLCREHRIQLNHHDALSDALACATLYLHALQNQEV